MKVVIFWFIVMVVYIVTLFSVRCEKYMKMLIINIHGFSSLDVHLQTLRLSSSAKKSTTVGEIINMMSVDSSTISESMWSVNDIWAVPMLFCLAFYCLWQTLGMCLLLDARDISIHNEI